MQSVELSHAELRNATLVFRLGKPPAPRRGYDCPK